MPFTLTHAEHVRILNRYYSLLMDSVNVFTKLYLPIVFFSVTLDVNLPNKPQYNKYGKLKSDLHPNFECHTTFPIIPLISSALEF